MFFRCKNFMFSDFTGKKIFAPGNGGEAGIPLHPFPYGAEYTDLLRPNLPSLYNQALINQLM